MTAQISVIGAGLSGCAAALAAAARGVGVTLYEQRPATGTEIHHTALLGELTGTADLGVEDPDRATGLLKAELRVTCPAIMHCAEDTRIGDQTLSVDRADFTCALAERIDGSKAIDLRREEVQTLPDGPVVIATGPTTWSPFARAIHQAARAPFHFSFAGRAPLIAADTLDLSDARWLPRYPGAEEALFLPLADHEAEQLTERLASAEVCGPPGFDAETVLADESSTAERMAADPEAGLSRMLRGPRGPEVDFDGPALSLAPDDAARSAFHVEGMLTSISPEAQQEALQAIDALADAQILRPGLVHRTPWLAGRNATLASLQLRRTSRAFVTGTLTGVYGYAEAMALGAAAGIGAARLAGGSEPLPPPQESLTGALCWALAEHEPHPDGRMLTANFGMIPEHREDQGLDKAERRDRQHKRALEAIKRYVGAD